MSLFKLRCLSLATGLASLALLWLNLINVWIFLTLLLISNAWPLLLLYAIANPRSRIFANTFIQADSTDKILALTYDDGPNAHHTANLLNALAAADVRATFFTLGNRAVAYPELMQRIIADGHEIGNHSQNHRYLAFCCQDTIRHEISQAQANITAVSGHSPQLFRPPYGCRDDRVIAIAEALGLKVIQWSITARDWRCLGVTKIVATIMSQVRPGAIVLLHDGDCRALAADRSQTVEATKIIIPQLRQRGYRLVTISEMLSKQQTEAELGVSSSRGETRLAK